MFLTQVLTTEQSSEVSEFWGKKQVYSFTPDSMVLAVVWTLTNSSTYCFGKQRRLCNAWMLNKTDMMKVKALSVWNGPGQACTPVRLAPVRLLFLNCVYNLRWKLLTLKMTEFVNKFHLLQQLHRLPDENQKMPLTMKNFDRQSVLACCCYLWNRRHNAVTWKHKHNKDCSFSHTHTYSLAEVSCGDISALFVLRVAASSTSVDGHTWWFIEYVGGSPKLPAHVDTHFPGNALCLPPFWLYACIKQVGSQTSRPFNAAAVHTEDGTQTQHKYHLV